MGCFRRACVAILAIDAGLLAAIQRGTSPRWTGQGPGGIADEAMNQSQGFRTPRAFIGDTCTIWTTGFAKYLLPYPVHFSRFGTFEWMAPFLSNPGSEKGIGAVLTPMFVESHNGTWTARYFSATRYNPGATTTCCCEYITWSDNDPHRVLTDYCRANLPGTGDRSLEDVCAPYSKEACPADNATAQMQMGIPPFVEVYGPCDFLDSTRWTMVGGALLLANFAAFGCIGTLWLRQREKEREEIESHYMHIAA